MERFEHLRRVAVSRIGRLERQYGVDAGAWMLGRLGVVTAPAKAGGAWVRIDDTLPPSMRGTYPDEHLLGRNVLLFPGECEPAHDRAYAPFHLSEMDAALDQACQRFDNLFRTQLRADERAWWADVTDERQPLSPKDVLEHIYRFGVGRRKVSVLLYSSVSTVDSWSRSASDDAIRFVHEVRSATPSVYLDTKTIVKRTGSAPLGRVQDRLMELLDPRHVQVLARQAWSPALPSRS